MMSYCCNHSKFKFQNHLSCQYLSFEFAPTVKKHSLNLVDDLILIQNRRIMLVVGFGGVAAARRALYADFSNQ